MNHMQMDIHLPETLTAKNVSDIVYVFEYMSLATKQNFLASLLITHDNHYKKIVKAIGNNYQNIIANA